MKFVKHDGAQWFLGVCFKYYFQGLQAIRAKEFKDSGTNVAVWNREQQDLNMYWYAEK